MENVVDTLHYETVLPVLKEVLERISSKEELREFRLVGGTNLSLRFGHRMSDDIGYFTPQEYGTADFDGIYAMLREEFDYIYGGVQDSMEGRWCRSWSCGNINGHPGRDASLYQINQL